MHIVFKLVYVISEAKLFVPYYIAFRMSQFPNELIMVKSRNFINLKVVTYSSESCYFDKDYAKDFLTHGIISNFFCFQA